MSYFHLTERERHVSVRKRERKGVQMKNEVNTKVRWGVAEQKSK